MSILPDEANDLNFTLSAVGLSTTR